MRTLRYVICDVFTSQPLSGNQLAVFTDARGVPEGMMQRLALEMGFSESAFVLPSRSGHHAQVRIFTPRRELPFAGHPALGTALVLAGSIESREVRLELDAGVVAVAIEREAARATFGWMTQPLPVRLESPERAPTLAALGLDEGAVRAVSRWSQGPEQLLVEVADEEVVAHAAPDAARLGRQAAGVASVFAVTSEGVVTRAFAPALGIHEDAATGSATGAIAAQLALTGRLNSGETLRVAQGAQLARPSELFARVTLGPGDTLTQVEVGGAAVVVARGEFRLPF